MVSILASRPKCFEFNSQHSRKFSKIIGVAEVNQQSWLEESVQWLENVDLTQLVLAGCKPELQKSYLHKTSKCKHSQFEENGKVSSEPGFKKP